MSNNCPEPAQNRSLHWYARAVKKGGHVYLVTATALDSSWEKQKKELVKSVDSFKIAKKKAVEN